MSPAAGRPPTGELAGRWPEAATAGSLPEGMIPATLPDRITPGTLSEGAPAKINLALHVLGRRDDGYHELDSLVVFAGVGDRLSAAPADGLSLTVSGAFGAALAAESDNLVLRAARALAAWAGIAPRVRLHLEKHLPVASGIGGGSADAAAALRLLRRLWRLDPPAASLASIAAGLGADVPVCLAGSPARMRGVGDRLSPLPSLPPLGLLLVNPGVAVATGPVFRALAGAFGAPLPPLAPCADAGALALQLAAMRNDLEAPARRLAPAVGDALAAIASHAGCRLARMSGSGATCFGLFDDADAAAHAADVLARPGWWCWGGGIAGHEGFAPAAS